MWGGPVWDPAHLAIPPVAAFSVRTLFLLPAKSRSGEKHVKSSPHGMPLVPPGAPFARDGGGGAYRLGRSCRSFFTQGVSGSTQTLSRLFSLILENTRGFSTPPLGRGGDWSSRAPRRFS